ncbi:MAG: sigma-54 dependent transcriptional regulator [Pseudomonadota bacterium]
MSETILIVDDQADMLELLSRVISERTPYKVLTSSDPLEVTDLLTKTPCELVISDLKMPGLDGLGVLKKVKELDDNTAVIIMTAFGTIETAIDAMRKGAFDYISKPFRKERMLATIEKGLEWHRLRTENKRLRQKLEEHLQYGTIIGSSPAMQQLYEKINQVSKTSATIMITGESGSGKELVARAIHSQSLRGAYGFIPVNCSALPESLIESELFGHLRGAFTGAIREHKGLIEEAHKGTLFVDEVGDMSPLIQIKLLRILQEGELKKVGDSRITKVDVRIISATHQDLSKMIKQGHFREDLYYRLNVIHIHLPPLRERKEDIPLLAHHFLAKYNSINNKTISDYSPGALAALRSYHWPGNIRQLENVVERAVILCSHEIIDTKDLFPADSVPASDETTEALLTLPYKEARDKLFEGFNRRYITHALAQHAGNVSRASKEAGLKRQYFHRLMKDYGIQSGGFRVSEE